MQQNGSTNASAGCYHILRWSKSGIYCSIALYRCYRSRSAASTARYRGLSGNRSRDGDYLEPHGDGNRLQVVRCNTGCPCHKWRTGHNADNIPAKPEQRHLLCHDCGKPRRKVIEVTDPADEVQRMYCEPCAKERVLRITFRGCQPSTRWRHADEPAMLSRAVWQ